MPYTGLTLPPKKVQNEFANATRDASKHGTWQRSSGCWILKITLPMRKNILSLSRFPGLVLLLLIGFCAGKASAQIYAQDDAAIYSNSIGGNFAWLSGSNTNGGVGVQPWGVE